MLKEIKESVRLPKVSQFYENFNVLEAEGNPNFDSSKPISEENMVSLRFAVSFHHNDDDYVVCMSDYTDNNGMKDCYTFLCKKEDYVLHNMEHPILEKIEYVGKTTMYGEIPLGMEEDFNTALHLGNDAVLESLGQHTNSFEDITLKINYGIEDRRDDKMPYFHISCEGYDKDGQLVSSYVNPSTYLSFCPELKDLSVMSGRNIVGEPYRAVDVGWDMLNMYSNENSKGFLYDKDSYRRTMLVNYLDFPIELADSVVNSFKAGNLTKDIFSAVVDTQRPVWKQQADAIIQKYGLEVRKDHPFMKEKTEKVNAKNFVKKNPIKANLKGKKLQNQRGNDFEI